jgi:hypothetical protein
MSAAPMEHRRDPILISTSPRLIATLTLGAFLAAGASGCDWLWPFGSNPPKEASKETVKSTSAVAPAAPAAPAAPPDATAIEAPARMTLAQQADFDAWLIKTYLGCWRPAPQPADADPYIAQVRLAYKPDGSLSKPPKLVNPPSNPALKPQAKSVMAAVQNCNPLPMPAQYRPFYEQWKTFCGRGGG